MVAINIIKRIRTPGKVHYTIVTAREVFDEDHLAGHPEIGRIVRERAFKLLKSKGKIHAAPGFARGWSPGEKGEARRSKTYGSIRNDSIR